MVVECHTRILLPKSAATAPSGPEGWHPGEVQRIYEVRAERNGRIHSFGARRTRDEADQLLADSEARVAHVGGQNDRYWVEEIDVTGMFEIPRRPAPRERYSTRVLETTPEGSGTRVHVEVLDGDRVVADYNRNYAMLQTFEPFRQGDRDFALISPDYTATSVMDLSSGEIIAGEEPHPSGFCPVGYYVPDWWDLHSGSVLPGSMHWRMDDEWPSGDFGFVWGCIWGDDSSWKVQYLDLSRIQGGILSRDDRFGYVKLACHPKLEARDFIRCWSWEGKLRVEFAIEQTYDLDTGQPTTEA
jgi:hypothetical protein